MGPHKGGMVGRGDVWGSHEKIWLGVHLLKVNRKQETPGKPPKRFWSSEDWAEDGDVGVVGLYRIDQRSQRDGQGGWIEGKPDRAVRNTII